MATLAVGTVGCTIGAYGERKNELADPDHGGGRERRRGLARLKEEHHQRELARQRELAHQQELARQQDLTRQQELARMWELVQQQQRELARDRQQELARLRDEHQQRETARRGEWELKQQRQRELGQQQELARQRELRERVVKREVHRQWAKAQKLESARRHDVYKLGDTQLRDVGCKQQAKKTRDFLPREIV
eukprot:CAMPEP_0114249304 /NCGR_PEP_ID=MMETSP0058-20121206/14068_1 /TAXON_ID=36894 /ORGANISM="Pyramimonas parkeae, CCMP726" /LENGTH=192 /DNA_ID=CAMNT_0001362835 /DNA_START=112 /DNA_END=691 /DNA_ORIENTATION=-